MNPFHRSRLLFFSIFFSSRVIVLSLILYSRFTCSRTCLKSALLSLNIESEPSESSLISFFISTVNFFILSPVIARSWRTNGAQATRQSRFSLNPCLQQAGIPLHMERGVFSYNKYKTRSSISSYHSMIFFHPEPRIMVRDKLRRRAKSKAFPADLPAAGRGAKYAKKKLHTCQPPSSGRRANFTN